MKSVAKCLAAIAAFAMPAGLLAQPAYNETGWRPATEEEKKFREAFERGKGTWSRSDGVEQMYSCMIAWAIWGGVARETDDLFPTISGELSHVFADGQLSHYLNTLYSRANGDVEVFSQHLITAASTIEEVMDLSDLGGAIRFMGKCHVPPSSWNFAHGVTMTGPEFSREFLMQTDLQDSYPVYVKFPEERAVFDQLVLQKRFAEAANYAAEMHADEAKKSTVYWHEVLELSAIAVANGEGTELSVPLLSTLSKVWWPKYRREWAVCALDRKQGRLCKYAREQRERERAAAAAAFREPGWVTQERNLQSRNMLNYTPCNQWNRSGC
jgi:hypothetical protein